MKKLCSAFLCGILIVSLGSCKATQNANNKQKGGVIGAAGGALLGAIIGNNTGKKGSGGELGTVIGGVVGGAAGVLIGNKMDKQAQRIEEEMPGAKVERLDDSIVITFDENSGVSFDTNKYNINADSEDLLLRLVGILKEYPNTNVLVEGHTDSSGEDTYNMALSKHRAVAVTDFLTKNNLMPNRFTTNWYGEEKPIAENDTSGGRAKNRRVNMSIVPNGKMKQEAIKDAAEN